MRQRAGSEPSIGRVNPVVCVWLSADEPAKGCAGHSYVRVNVVCAGAPRSEVAPFAVAGATKGSWYALSLSLESP